MQQTAVLLCYTQTYVHRYMYACCVSLLLSSHVSVAGGYDFFLVSQNVREGTVSPSHYRVVYDTTGLKPDHMQR